MRSGLAAAKGRDWCQALFGGAACCVHTFTLHDEPITTVQWCPDQKGVFASGSEDGYLNIWDITRIGAAQTPEQKKAALPELLFQHAGMV